MFKQVVQIDKKELVDILNGRMYEVIEAVEAEVNPNLSISDGVKQLKPRVINYYAGWAQEILVTIEMLGVYVDKTARNKLLTISGGFKHEVIKGKV